MSHASYRVHVPPTKDMGTFRVNCSQSLRESRAANALWQYNSARAHDGLPPLKRMPPGTTYHRNWGT